jgi:hypothetical protein
MSTGSSTGSSKTEVETQKEVGKVEEGKCERVTLSIRNANKDYIITNEFTKMNTIGDVKNKFYEKYCTCSTIDDCVCNIMFVFSSPYTSLQTEWTNRHSPILKSDDLLLGEMDFLWQAEPNAEFKILFCLSGDEQYLRRRE